MLWRMLFCPKCSGLMKPYDGKLKCDCGHIQKEGSLKEKKKVKREVEVVDEHESHPITKEDCPKCKHDKAYHWSAQTRASDEPETLFFKCVKCSYQWREY